MIQRSRELHRIHNKMPKSEISNICAKWAHVEQILFRDKYVGCSSIFHASKTFRVNENVILF